MWVVMHGFCYLTGHAPSDFVHRSPGPLRVCISATLHLMLSSQHTSAWNVLSVPGDFAGNALVQTVSGSMAAVLLAVVCILVIGMSEGQSQVRLIIMYWLIKLLRLTARPSRLLAHCPGRAPLVGLKPVTVASTIRWNVSTMLALRVSLLYLEQLCLANTITIVIPMLGFLAWGDRATEGRSSL